MSVTHPPTRAIGGYREGDDPGERLFVSVGDLSLESGDTLPGSVVAYETWGELAPSGDNAILIEHALTGDSHVTGPASAGHATPGWWGEVVGPGKSIDTNRYFVVAANVIGGCQGSTGPASLAPDGRPWGSRFPEVSVRDQVAAEVALADHLGVEVWRSVIGGSMGGMRSLEWAITHPGRVARAVVLASTGYATAEQIGWSQAQILAIQNDPWFAGGDYYAGPQGPEDGLALARRIAHVTYRSEQELHDRFGRDEQRAVDGVSRFAVESYLDHHGAKLAGRFDANSYIVLSRAMNSHDVGRGRGGLGDALARYTGQLTVVSVDSDRLYPPRLSRELAAARPGTHLASVASPVGHDAFLVESAQVGRILSEAIERP